MLPGVDGMTICQALKGDPKTAGVRIIMLTAKGEETDIIGAQPGAERLCGQALQPPVLMARVRARAPPAGDPAETTSRPIADEAIEFHNLKIHLGRHEVLVDGRRST